MLDLLCQKSVLGCELSHLHDCFDKVRVGLWLGIRLLEGNPPPCQAPLRQPER